MSDTALVIMARYPEQGKIKTRLASRFGDYWTLQLYQAFLVDLAHRFAGWHYDLHWAYTPIEVDFDRCVAMLASLDSSLWRSFPQDGLALGDRLHHVFRTTYERHFQNTIVTASDSPHMDREVISQARDALDSANLVLGPAEDGGYYLIAMREPYDVFSEIPMSTPAVLQVTIEKAQSLGLSVHLLKPLCDIDELADLERLAHMLQKERTLAPATAACLDSLMKELG